jgi:hypothetical protein
MNNLRNLALFLLLAFAQLAQAETLLFVINGQSNASGRGNLSQVPIYSNASRIFMYGNDGVWKQAYEPTDDPAGQLDTITIDNNAGAGFAMSFANRMADLYPNDNIGIIQCSVGASKVSVFRRFWTDTSRHGVCINRVSEAKAYGILKGEVWWQFEADTLTSAEALAWRESVSNVWADHREDFNAPEMPIVFAIANTLNPQTYWATLRNSQLEIKSPKVIGVPTAGYQFQSDNTHMTTQGYIDWGIAAANAMYGLMQ